MRMYLIAVLALFLLSPAFGYINIVSSVSPSQVYPYGDGIITLTLTTAKFYSDVEVSAYASEITVYNSYVSLGPMQTSDVRSTSFRFSVPKGARFYTVQIVIDAGAERFEETVPIQVVGGYASSIIEKEPMELYAGQETNLTIRVKNTGYKDIENGVFTLVVPSGFAVLDNSEKVVDLLDMEDNTTLSFQIRVDRDVGLGSHPFSLILSTGGQDVTEDFNVPVIGTPQLELAGINLDPTRVIVGSDLTLAVRLENLGTAEARSVNVEMTGSGFTGLKTDYVGSIDPDDMSSAVFELVPIFSGTQAVQFDISYLDDDGNSHTMTAALEIPVYETGGVDVVLLYLIIIVLLVLVVYLWRRK